MRIGIDAFWYFDGYSSLQRVTSNLVNHLLLNDKTNEYVLFIDKRFESQKFPIEQGAQVKVRYLKTGRLKYNLFLKLVILPFYSYVDKLDVLVTQYYPSPFSRGKRISFIYDVLFEDYPQLFTPREKYQLVPQRILSKLTHGIITISQSEKDRLLKHKYNKHPDKVTVFSLAADERFKPKSDFTLEIIEGVKRKYNLPEEFLLYVGLLSGRKNLDNLLRALPLLKSPIQLVITGSGHPTYASNHLILIEELRLNDRIQFTGFVDDKDLAVIYSLAKVFCFPSFAEGFGLPPLEALAAGVPVAVSDQTSLPEVCGEAGVYFNPFNPKEISDAIDKLIFDNEFYRSRQRMCGLQSAKFNWNNSANKLIDFFSNV
jgi:glycosyltransferase involved in cell wall biosynthesis